MLQQRDPQTPKVGVVGLVIHNNRILLGKRHANLTHLPNQWHLPGGFTEENENHYETLIREIQEEAHIEVIPENVIGQRFDEKRNIQIFYVKASVKDISSLQADSDLQAVKFVSPQQIPDFCTKEVVTKWPFDYWQYFPQQARVAPEFLQTTQYCDFEHINIQLISKHFKERYTSQRELACALFYFVRDTIRYELGNWNKKASTTLEIQKGSCSNCANLFVALARACNIPAAYGVMTVNGQEYFGDVSLRSLTSQFSKNSKHIYPLVYLDGKWLKCDTSDDLVLSINTQHLNKPSQVIEFDGYSDASLHLAPEHILTDEFPLASIDDILSKKMRRSLKLTVQLSNFYVDFLRKNGHRIAHPVQAEKDFFVWLSKNKPHYYMACKIYSLNKKVKDRFNQAH